MNGRSVGWATAGVSLVLLLAGCNPKEPIEADVLNGPAALPSAVAEKALNWPVLSVMADRSQGTMAILTGNERAVEAARAGRQGAYPNGSMLVLATWTQREDPHWFGARIPGRPALLEIVSFYGDHGPVATAYRRYTGVMLQGMEANPATVAERTNFITQLRPAVMP